MSERSEEFIEHLTELRTRLVRVALTLVIFMVGGLFAAEPLISYLKHVEPAADITWNAFSPWDAFRIYLQFAFVIALVVVIPHALLELWGFVKPGLREAERGATLRYIPFAVLLFLLGLSFAYFFLFPMTFNFSRHLSEQMGLTLTYGISQYFTFMFNILLPVSLLFELPVVVLFLTKIRILNPKILRKFRRFAYMILVVVSALFGPPDIASIVLMVLPLLLLYEISVYLSGIVYRKQLEKDREWGLAD